MYMSYVAREPTLGSPDLELENVSENLTQSKMLSVTQKTIRPHWDNLQSVGPEVLVGPCLSHRHRLGGGSEQKHV